MFTIFITLILICIILLLILAVKNEITYKIQRERIKEISTVVRKRIEADVGYDENSYEKCMRVYEHILLNPFIWTKNQAYPTSAEEQLAEKDEL